MDEGTGNSARRLWAGWRMPALPPCAQLEQQHWSVHVGGLSSVVSAAQCHPTARVGGLGGGLC